MISIFTSSLPLGALLWSLRIILLVEKEEDWAIMSSFLELFLVYLVCKQYYPVAFLFDRLNQFLSNMVLVYQIMILKDDLSRWNLITSIYCVDMFQILVMDYADWYFPTFFSVFLYLLCYVIQFFLRTWLTRCTLPDIQNYRVGSFSWQLHESKCCFLSWHLMHRVSFLHQVPQFFLKKIILLWLCRS